MATPAQLHNFTAETLTLLGAALAYAERGWPVIPLHRPTAGGCSCKSTRRPTCGEIGKHPRIAGGTDFGNATTDLATIRRWWRKWPSANIGMAVGRAGLVVVDIDLRHGGHETWAEIVGRLGVHIADTLTARTGSGGLHLYYLAPPDVRITSRNGQLGHGLDVKSAGGLVVAPPSLHANGCRYEWMRP